jgi:hypothetical protein
MSELRVGWFIGPIVIIAALLAVRRRRLGPVRSALSALRDSPRAPLSRAASLYRRYRVLNGVALALSVGPIISASERRGERIAGETAAVWAALLLLIGTTYFKMKRYGRAAAEERHITGTDRAR